MEFRKEIKYLISNKDFNLINESLKTIMKKDEYCNDNFYTITSIYFDDYNKTSYNQVLNGISRRWKYRIRFYNYDDSFIKLEKKYKENNLTNKKDTIITKEVLYKILNHSIKVVENNDSLLNEFIIKMNTEYLRPVMIIEYDRIPYVYKVGSVRITLDFNIRYNNRFNDLFNSNKKMYYLKENILEVKFNELVPDFIIKRIGLNTLTETSFSKYLNSVNSFIGGNLNGIKY